MIQKLCILTDRYPTDQYPINTFLDQLVCQFADMGIDCTVVAPYCRIVDKLKKNNYNPPYYREKKTHKGNVIKIYSPSFFSLSGKKLWGINFATFYQKQFEKTAREIVQKHGIVCDAFYAHFIVPAGLTAKNLALQQERPVYIAYGESSLSIITEKYEKTYIQKQLKDVNGIIAVSSKNMNELIDNGFVERSKIDVFPNSIDNTVFYKKDKKEFIKKIVG